MADFHKSTSRYVDTPVVEFYLDIWQEVTIEPSVDDQTITLDPKYHERPDLLAYDRYGTPRLWWVFAIRNVNYLIDPIADFKTGMKLIVPPLKSVEGYI